jgi:protocatechuate 3,4-dioxygenase beta subunit
MRMLSVALAAALAQVPASPPGPAPAASGMLSGRVIDAATQSPVAGVVVTLLMRPAPGAPPVQSTGQYGGVALAPVHVLVGPTGHFTFSSLRAGTYELVAAKRGYVSGAIGKLRPDGPGQSLALVEQARHADITLRVWKHASIAGTVIDEAGEPVVGVTAQALRRESIGGEPRFVIAASGSTDDRGVYRIGALLAGEYLVSVPSTVRSVPRETAEASAAAMMRADDPRLRSAMAPPGTSVSQRVGDVVIHTPLWAVVNPEPGADGRLSVYTTAFLPAPPGGADTSLIVVRAGETKTVAAVQLRPVSTVRIAGRITVPGGPAAQASIALVPDYADGIAYEGAFETARTTADAAGRFTFPGVAPGTYRLTALKADAPSNASFWAAETIAVGATDMSLDIALKDGLSVAGSFVFEGKSPPPSSEVLQNFAIVLRADGRQITEFAPRTRPGPGGSFVVPGLAGGRYVIQTSSLSRPWSLKSVTYRGQEVIDVPIEVADSISDVVVTFTDQPAAVQGVVRRGDAPDAQAFVMLFPEDSRRWTNAGRTPLRMRGARATATGSYHFAAIPPGDYLIAAVHDADASDWQNPRMLAAAARQAVRVRIVAGATVTQDLRRAGR